MPIYTVHEPPARRAGTSADPERFAFVRDGFYFWAFLVPPLWMAARRLWLVLLGYVLLVALLNVALWQVGASSTVRTLVSVLLSLLVGFEAASLRRWALARRGWKQVGVVVGDDLELAERRFFSWWVGEDRARPWPADTGPAVRAAPAQQQIVGLFPEPGAPR
jgi:hypothetical protein